MAGTHITIEVDDRALRQAIGELLAQIADPRPALEEIGEVLTQSTKRRFATETDPEGNRWAENSDVTLLRHLERGKGVYTKKGNLSAKGARRIGGKKILTDSGDLGDLITWQMAGPKALAVGSDRFYAAVQQFGAAKGAFGKTTRNAPIPWGDIPPRPFLGLSDEDGERVVEILRDYLGQAVP